MARFPQPRPWYPKNPKKYAGNLQIIARSSWEVKFLNWCDVNTSVLAYSSEETIIPYRCLTDNKIHRYFVDFKVKIKNKHGDINTYLIEIKPKSQTIPPKFPGKRTKRYLTETLTYMKNKSKWDAAKQFALDRGWKFLIFTETMLGIK